MERRLGGEEFRHRQAQVFGGEAHDLVELVERVCARVVGKESAGILAGLLFKPCEQRQVGHQQVRTCTPRLERSRRSARSPAHGHLHRDQRQGSQDAGAARTEGPARPARCACGKVQKRITDVEGAFPMVLLVVAGVLGDVAQLGQEPALVVRRPFGGALLVGQLHVVTRGSAIGGGSGHDLGAPAGSEQGWDNGRRVEVREAVESRQVQPLTAGVRTAVEAGTTDQRVVQPLQQPLEDFV